MSSIKIDRYKGHYPGPTHTITIEPNEQTGQPDIPLMDPGLCFQDGDGPVLKIVTAVVRHRQVEGGGRMGKPTEIEHYYIAEEVGL